MCPAGTLYMLNTKFLKLVAHEQRAELEVEGPHTPPQQDARIWKLMWAGNLVCQSSRLQGRATSLT
jgi:hypothetical protein